MKAIHLIPLWTFGIFTFGCQSTNTTSSATADTLMTSTAVGSDTDSLGCKGSAGYIWSQIKKTCIRPWEEGIELRVMNTSSSFQTAAYVVVDSIQREAEVFMAEDQNSILLKQMSAQNYSNGNFNLTKEDHCWTLSLNDTKLYQEPIM
ncbi:hypothetical protein G5B30_12890 [Sphingobacterium sp. SGG-5]|uniref:hypothetical protein n=1 Tax=Sphingobacterium sp. SGG-5 TaxID=2710881 RepID=UPI0013EABFA8|nr:hypothetical protein [Sphingobacterium sp. SGG-5]NGM62808.1 hypothetical protein [Sphingobacterium sp. SGG-5]